MDEIEKRMRDAADNCIKCYETWRGSQKDSEARGNLMEAVHELRKVAARLEIEIAVSERDEMTARHIPIPPHRSMRRSHQDSGPRGGDFGGDDNIGNSANSEQGHSQSHGHGGGGGGRDFRPRGGGGGGPRRRPEGGHHRQGGDQ